MGAFWLSLLGAVVVLLLIVWPFSRLDWVRRVPRAPRLLAIGAGVGYGLLGRIVFGFGYADWHPRLPGWLSGLLPSLSASFSVMSLSFLFLLPMVIGFLDQRAPDPVARKRPVLRAFFAPMVPVLLMLALTAVLSIEGALCIAMALPAFLFFAGVGGWLGLAARRNSPKSSQSGGISLMIALPFLFAPVEQHVAFAVEQRQVENTVHVRAAPSVVWREIKSVRAIAVSELSLRVSHVIGLPRPIEATLSRDGVGGVRMATFERGLTFRETVTDWQPERRLSFQIAAEPAPKTALDEHVAVGGAYFDVLDGTYELVPLADGSTLLKLTSHQRLSTHFNFYARLWTDFIMSDLQSSIMDVIRNRCERATSAPVGRPAVGAATSSSPSL